MLSISATAQVVVYGHDDKDYSTKQLLYGVMFQSKGWGLSFDYAERKGKDYTIFDFDFVSLKHPKEVRIINGGYDNPPAYVYGKLNKAFTLRAGYGIKKYIGVKPDKTNVQLFSQFTGGLDLCLLKPVYLQIIKPAPNGQGVVLVEERYNPEIHTDQSAIYGESSFSTGFGSSTIEPGLFVKAAGGIEWGNYTDEMRSLTFGLTIDAFPKRLPIMSKVENKSVFSTFFISFAFGNKI